MSGTPPVLAQPELAAVQIGGTTRGAFLLRTALAAGAVYGAGAVAGFTGAALAQNTSNDTDIVNFALTLELLEAAFYERALKEVDGLSGKQRRLTEELADNEAQHVEALTATATQLGGRPASGLEFDFGDAFESVDAYLKLANTFEDTGVSAYNGAGPLIQSMDILNAAGSIVQVEARHAALVRLQRGVPPAPLTFDRASPMDEVLEAISPFIVE